MHQHDESRIDLIALKRRLLFLENVKIQLFKIDLNLAEHLRIIPCALQRYCLILIDHENEVRHAPMNEVSNETNPAIFALFALYYHIIIIIMLYSFI